MTEYEAEASGRVNLIGEHTDYNGGYVLPTAIPQKTRVKISPLAHPVVQAASKQFKEQVEYRFGEETKRGNWGDYLQGITKLLREDGHLLQGFRVTVESEVPVGSGLSSSAALGVSLMRGLKKAFQLSLGDLEIAKLHQRVENEFVGARVGIMDPMAASLASWGEALFIDTAKMTYQKVPLPLDQVELVVINSGVSHRNASGGYNLRRQECEEACRQLKVKELRELDEHDLDRVNALPEPFCRRARHVIMENARVLSAVDALLSGDFLQLGKLFYESHHSMRDDYEVSVPQIDGLVTLAKGLNEVFGCRLTGGGFGGSIVALVRKRTSEQVSRQILDGYRREFGLDGQVLVPRLDLAL